MAGIIEELIREQRENEWLFVTEIYSWGGDVERQNLNWLSGDIFVVPELGKFWESFKQHGQKVIALNDAGITDLDVVERLSLSMSFGIHPDQFAELIANTHFYLEILKDYSSVARFVTSKDMAGLQEFIKQMGDKVPHRCPEGHTTAEIVQEVINIVDQPGGKAVKTRIAELDSAIGAFFPDEFTILAARPGVGKTALCLQIARNVAVQKRKVLFLSLEMSRVQLWARMACGYADLDWKDVRAGNISQVNRDALKAALKELQDLYGDYLIIEDESWGLYDLQQKAIKHNPDLVIIDHLGETARTPPDEKDIVWYPRAARFIRQYITRGLHVPTIVVHQMNRNADQRGSDEKRPELSDLRGSGELEQIADIVLMGYREDYYNSKMSHITTVPFELMIRKHRQGASASTILLSYDLKKQWFDSPNSSPMRP